MNLFDFFYTRIFQSSKLRFTVVYVFIVFCAGHSLLAQTPCSETDTKKAIEPVRQVTKNYLLEVLNKESVCYKGELIPIPLERRNTALLGYVRKFGINFVLTPNIEEQLKNAGASKDLMAVLKRENAKITDPKVVFINLGMEANANKDYDEAIANYTEAINLDPDSRIAYTNRGVVYKTLGDILKKEKNFEEANKNYDKAIEDFTQVIRIDSTNRSGYYYRGSCYYEKPTNNDVPMALANMDKAIADYTEAIRIDPKFTDAYKSRADAYQFQGKSAEAEADRQKVKEIRQSL